MLERLRCVVDTNVLISAVLVVGGKPYRAVEAVLEHGTMLASAETLAELESRLMRPKFDRYVSRAGRRAFLDFVASQAALVAPAERITACRDPDDDKFLELAVSASADCIVSGDRDLLALDPFRGIPILTPAAFLATLEARTPG